MKLEARIAWRSVWRQPGRSFVLMGAVALAVFTFVGSTAFTDGFGQEMIRSAVDLQGGHIRMSAAGYEDNPTLQAVVPDSVIQAVPGVLSESDVRMAPQVISMGMVNAPEQSAAVQINGVDVVLESRVTTIPELVFEGSWLADSTDIVMGAELADRLGVRLGEKVVLMANNTSNEVGAAAYRISGLYRSSMRPFDRMQVFVTRPAARHLLGLATGVSTVTIVLEDLGAVNEQAAELRKAWPDLDVLTWQDRNPMLEMAEAAYDWSAWLMAVILFTAVGFILVNAFLMVIFERVKEFGVMLAIGTRPAVIRRMLVMEALFISLLGMAGGIVLSVLGLGYWFVNGLDLGAFSSGLTAYGISPVIHPVLDPFHLLPGFVIIFVMVLLAVQYPAWRASRFHAVEALHHD
jgi:ABC-type lipoprotein release transport system permease subunit